ncbi:MAG: hypothetical protein WBE50_07785, partial [Methyloceanibacter sp.]
GPSGSAARTGAVAGMQTMAAAQNSASVAREDDLSPRSQCLSEPPSNLPSPFECEVCRRASLLASLALREAVCDSLRSSATR